jgi:lysophospholipase L1-like esterase
LAGATGAFDRVAERHKCEQTDRISISKMSLRMSNSPCLHGLCITVFLAVACACGPSFDLSPQSGSSFGNYEVNASGTALDHLGDPLTVTVGGIAAYDVNRPSTGVVAFTVQGAPKPGPATVEISGPSGNLNGKFEYLPPVDGHLARLVGIGASLTMGMQSASLSVHSQTHGPVAQFAKAAGAYFSLPLVKDGLLPALEVSDFDPNTCQLTGGQTISSLITQKALATAVPQLEDANGVIHIDRARIDPYLTAQNVAIGGFRVTEVVNGGVGLIEVVFENAVWDPFVNPADLFNPASQTMLQVAVGLDPTIVLNTDLFANDVDNVDLSGSSIPDLSALTALTDVQAALGALIAQLDSTGADYFLATCPDVTVLPAYAAKVQCLLAAGYSQAEATGWVGSIQQRITDINSALEAASSSHPKLHVVDLYTYVGNVWVNGADVGGTHLSPKPFGGLLSLDGLHFSDTGYALLAEQYVKAVNAALGTFIPDVDPVPVLAEDPFSVANLQAQGMTCAGK